MSKKEFSKLVSIGIGIVFVLTIFISFYVMRTRNHKNNQVNIVNNKLINWGSGWKNHKSLYSGDELRLSFKNSETISFKARAENSGSDEGIQIEVDNRYYSISTPNINSQKLSIILPTNEYASSHSVKIRHFCDHHYLPCGLTIDSIIIDDNGILLDSPPLPQKTLAILGDSISTNFGLDNYSFLLADNLKYQLHNASVFGSSVSEIKGLDYSFKRYERDIVNYKPDVVIIFLGTNDVSDKIPLATFEINYDKLIKEIIRKLPNSKVIAASILFRKDIEESTILEYNQLIEKISNQTNSIYVNINNSMGYGDLMDNIHPAKTSQQKIAGALFTGISKNK